jgi:hypothetical protein
VCCAAACALNAAGCLCGTGVSALLDSMHRPGYPAALSPDALRLSTCGLGTIYSTAAGNCASLPPGGSALCPQAAPPSERSPASAGRRASRLDNLASVLTILASPASAGRDETAVVAALRSKVSPAFAVADTAGVLARNPGEVHAFVIKPKMKLPGAKGIAASARLGATASFTDR